ncbi:MAG: MoxR family ATPase [Planctomycetes bacterium]|nr:MoxR family ATPase [Planctomycetota bacterium]
MSKISWTGTNDYIASPALTADVNAAIALGRPLLVKGEPGTGKTLLARSIAEGLGMPMLTWDIKSTTKAQEGLYEYDVVRRLNDARFGEGDITQLENYIDLGVLGKSFEVDERIVLLIDEIDKADIEFPNDLLKELDLMEFTVRETNRVVKAKHRPIVIITSNAEKELPDAFLRRCVFHYIEFPDTEMMRKIVGVHFPDLEEKLVQRALSRFYFLRSVEALRKKPSTSEFLDWIFVLLHGGVSADRIEKDIPYIGSLIKKETDLTYLKQARHIRN